MTNPTIQLLRDLAATCRRLAPQVGDSLSAVTPLADDTTWSGTYPRQINDRMMKWNSRLSTEESALVTLADQAEAKANVLEAAEAML